MNGSSVATDRVLFAGTLPGASAGSASTEALLAAALQKLGTVTCSPTQFTGAVSTAAFAAAYRDYDLLLVPSNRKDSESWSPKRSGHVSRGDAVRGHEAMIRESGAALLVEHSLRYMYNAAINILGDSEQWRAMAHLTRE